MRPRDTVENLTAYSAPLEGRTGKLRLDFNENTVGPSPKVRQAIQNIGPHIYAAYPAYSGFTKKLAEYTGVSSFSILPLNGVDAGIKAIFDAYGQRDAGFLTADPTFGYYFPCAAAQGMQFIKVPYLPDLSYPLDDIESELKKGPKIFAICNPDNPTGSLVEAEKIIQWVRKFPNILFVVDEIYVDFTQVTIVPDMIQYPNVIVLRSFSKAFGLAGFRVGYAIAQSGILEHLRKVMGPYDLSTPAIIAAEAALSDLNYVKQYVEDIKVSKAFTLEALNKLNRKTFCGAANYILVWPKSDCELIQKRLQDRGILVRSMAGKTVIDGAIRVTIGTKLQMKQFIAAFSILDT
ncbi:MAG: histidinol-phosphate transaminase [Pseudomonadota bacterium]